MNATIYQSSLLSPLRLRGRRQPGLWVCESAFEAETLVALLCVKPIGEVDR